MAYYEYRGGTGAVNSLVGVSELIMYGIANQAPSDTWRPIDDTPVNGVTTESISSNWAYDFPGSNPTFTSGLSSSAVINADATGTAISSDGDLSFTGSGDLIQFSSDIGPKIQLYGSNFGLGVSSAELNIYTNTGGDISFRADSSTGTEHMELDTATGNLKLLTGELDVDGTGTNTMAGGLYVASGVGIGQISAAVDLHVGDGTDASETMTLQAVNTGVSQYEFGDNNDRDVGRLRYEHSTNDFEIWTNAGMRMQIDSSGDTIFTDKVRAEVFHLETDPTNHQITDDANCVIITGDTSTLNIC